MITPEQAETLTTTGSIQIGSEYMPPDFNALLRAAAHSNGVHGRAYMQRVLDVYPVYKDILEGVLQAAGYVVPVNPSMASTVYFKGLAKSVWHTDFNNALFGFSVLVSGRKDAEDGVNRLTTGGRGEAPDTEDATTYNYIDGPIIIAQKEFCTPDTPLEVPLGATWHTSERTVNASFVSLDILSISRR